MNRFVTSDGAPRTPERAEMLARVDPTLDRPVILFQDVIEILHRAVLAVVGQIACGLEHGNGGWVNGGLVPVDVPPRPMGLQTPRFCQQNLRRFFIPVSRGEAVGSRTP